MPLLSIECQTLTKQSRWIIAMSMVHLPKTGGIKVGWTILPLPDVSGSLGDRISLGWTIGIHPSDGQIHSPMEAATPVFYHVFFLRYRWFIFWTRKCKKNTSSLVRFFLSPKNPRTNTNKTIDCGEGFPLYTCRILVLRAKMRPRRRPPLRYPPCWASASPRWGEPGIVRWTGK